MLIHKRVHVCPCALLCVSMYICGSRELVVQVCRVTQQQTANDGKDHWAESWCQQPCDTSLGNNPTIQNTMSLATYCDFFFPRKPEYNTSVLWPAGPFPYCRGEKEITVVWPNTCTIVSHTSELESSLQTSSSPHSLTSAWCELIECLWPEHPGTCRDSGSLPAASRP